MNPNPKKKERLGDINGILGPPGAGARSETHATARMNRGYEADGWRTVVMASTTCWSLVKGSASRQSRFYGSTVR
jgi:hypothetical protein